MNPDKIPADEPAEPRIHAHKTVWQGHRRMDAVDIEVHLTAERPAIRKIYDLVRVGRAVIVMPYDPVAGRLVMLRQFRTGAHFAHGLGSNVEFIGGRMEAGEVAEEAARRETVEECGLQVLDLKHLFDVAPNPAVTDEFSSVFIARVDARGMPSVAGEIAEEETILPFLATPDQVFAAVDQGLIRNGYVLLCSMWFRLNKASIDQMWSARR